MIDWIPTIPDQSLWIICALFFVSDTIRNVAPGQLILTRNSRDSWAPAYPNFNFKLAKRALTFLNPLKPWAPAVPMSTFDRSTGRRNPRRRLRVHQRHLLKFQILSCLVCLNVFIMGPILTHYMGLGRTIWIVLSLHTESVLFLLLFLMAERRFWRMQPREIASLVSECFLCPGYFANICRRVSLGWVRVPGGALDFGLANSAKKRDVERLRVLTYLRELTDEGTLQAAELAMIEQYRENLEREVTDSERELENPKPLPEGVK